MRANEAMREFLLRVGQIPLHQGPDAAGTRAKPATSSDMDFLRQLATTQSARNDMTLSVVLVLICATFVATSLGAWRTKDTATVATIVLTGAGGGMGLLAWLRVLWADSNLYTVMLIASQRLNADELVKLIAGLYFEKTNRRFTSLRKRAPLQPT